MSFYAEQLAVARSTSDVFVGVDAGNMVTAGNFTVRVNTANVIEMKTVVGTATVEYYRFTRWGAGALEAANGNAVTLTDSAWTLVDPLILTTGNDMVNMWVTETSPTATDWYEFKVWHPSATKVALSAHTIAEPLVATPLITAGVANSLTVNAANTLTHDLLGSVSSVNLATVNLVQHQRVTLPNAPVVSVFNGTGYQSANGWVPRVCGRKLDTTAGTYTNMGLNWRIIANGLWELYGDAALVTETWTVDIMFLRTPIQTVTRYGTFN